MPRCRRVAQTLSERIREMTYKLFLDDLRAPPDQTWIVARSVASAIEYVQTYGVPLEMSLDHDLGDGRDAPAFVSYLINEFLDDRISGVTRIKMYVHSANPVGRQNLYGTWESFVQFFKGH